MYSNKTSGNLLNNTNKINIFSTIYLLAAGLLCVGMPTLAHANESNQPSHQHFEIITIYSTKNENKKLGTIIARDTKRGLILSPKLFGLTPGTHGFHMHQFANCNKHGAAAGGHWDPNKTNKHLGPYNKNGHLGDLPPLEVNQKGQALQAVIAPRLKLSDLAGHSLMVHAGGDNFKDKPAANGGGGARIACGIIPRQTNKAK